MYLKAVFATLCTTASCTLAQPTAFFDIGVITPPTSPAFANEAIDITEMFDFDSDVEFSVQWARFTLSAPAAGDTFLDTSLFVSIPTEPVVVALYDNAGQLVAFDESQGGFTGAGGLSFGSTSERVPFTVPGHAGQDGSLPAGTYWIAFVAGPVGGAATLGATDWNVTTTATTTLGYDENENFVAPAIFVGNTTGVARPPNDDCANAIILSEDVGLAPAWQGVNFGATQDGASLCNTQIAGVTTKDIWFSYVPSQTGFAQIVASTQGVDNNDAVLSLFPSGCGTTSTRCVGNGNFVVAGGSRLGFPVTAGQPILFNVAQRGGYFGGFITLNIDLLPPPCDIQTPVSAIAENEVCGTSSNDGCFASPPAFDSVAPGDVIAGALFDSASARDIDWYQFTLAAPAIANVTLRGQAALSAVIQPPEAAPGECFAQNAAFGFRSDALNPCTPINLSAPLVAGTYKVAIAHTYRDEMGCDSGFSNYWFSLDTEPCDQPSIITQPVDQTGCIGSTVVYSAAFNSSEPISYIWQIGIASQFPVGSVQWLDLYDGTLDYANSLAEVSGSESPALTISGIDAEAAAALFFRVVATTCVGQTSRDAAFTLLPATACPTSCDDIDFNNNQVFPEDQDVIDFFNVLAGADCPECNDIDFNNNGVFPEDQDVIDFFNVLAGGECP